MNIRKNIDYSELFAALIEAEQSRASMILLYEAGFSDFTPTGLCEIHRYLFGDICDWAGKYRIINIEKRERLLAGRSVWYSNCTDIERDLTAVFAEIHRVKWPELFRDEFVKNVVRLFPKLWRVHPFREGNTRTVVMFLTFFVEHHGYFMDQELLAASAGYVRDSFVMASLDQVSEYEHLERILMDAICEEPIQYGDEDLAVALPASEKYRKYQKEDYTPEPHYVRE